MTLFFNSSFDGRMGERAMANQLAGFYGSGLSGTPCDAEPAEGLSTLVYF
jgi:hypothetical protein